MFKFTHLTYVDTKNEYIKSEIKKMCMGKIVVILYNLILRGRKYCQNKMNCDCID